MASQPAVHIIDDDEAVRDSLAVLLETHDLPVATYGSARAFLAALDAGARGCVVTDVQMPEMDGLTLLGVLKARGGSEPVVVITARAGREMAAEALAQGAFAFVEKPFEPGPFVDVVRAALAQAGA